MREKLKTVKNAVVHVLILLLVFIGAVVLFEKLINQSTPNSAQDMENSTFPLVYMQNKGVSYNVCTAMPMRWTSRISVIR